MDWREKRIFKSKTGTKSRQKKLKKYPQQPGHAQSGVSGICGDGADGEAAAEKEKPGTL